MNSYNRDLCASTGQKLLYWNCRGICSRREKLRKHLEEIEVFIGVETNLKKHKILISPVFVHIALTELRDLAVLLYF